jgi:hypothetical protein
MATPSTELRAFGPLEILDGALLVVRRGGGERALRAWAAAVPLLLTAAAVYYLERVEGVRSLRPLFALLLVLGFWLRSYALSRVAHGYALAIRPSLPVVAPLPRAVDVVGTASVVALGLIVWLWPLAAMALLSPLAVAAVLPFLALRGAVAPSWLARASCARERGLHAFGQAFDDTAGMRGAFLIVEMLALFGAIGLFGNLYALLSFVLLLGHSMLGLDVAFVSSFLSPDNAFVLLLLSALVLVLLEPLRAAISAQAFVDARSRRDGADLHAAVDAAIAQSGERKRRNADSLPPGAAALILVGCALGAGMAASAAAQTGAAETVDAPESRPRESAADAHAREQIAEILARKEFREFAERDDHFLSDLIERLLTALAELGSEAERDTESTPVRLPALSPWVLMALAVIALCLIAVYAAAGRRTAAPPARRAAAPEQLPAASGPMSLIDEAALLAARGDMRGALRALYVATLLMLDRKQLIEYETWKTNGQYIRAMPQGEARRLFAAFTRVFDRTWYGHEPASAHDYEQCRALAERLGAEVGT